MISTGVFSSRYSSILHSKLPLFFPSSHPLLPGVWVCFEHRFHSYGASSVFPQSFQPVNSRLGGHSSSLYLLRWIQFHFLVVIIFFPSAQVFSLLVRLSLVYPSGVLKTSQEFVCVCSNSRLSPHSNILIVPVHHLSLQQSFPTVLSLQWALTHRSFPRILPNSSNYFGAIPKFFSKCDVRMDSISHMPSPRSFSNSFHCCLNLFVFRSPGVP